MITKTRKIRLSELTFEPSFGIDERIAPGFVNLKQGQTIRAILSFKVIEKTKSFIILRIYSATAFPTKRVI
jgi:hypothetical protein